MPTSSSNSSSPPPPSVSAPNPPASAALCPLGRFLSLTVVRFGPPGAFLEVPPGSLGDATVVLLPRAEVPEKSAVGDVLDVFIYKDSDDRPIATRKTPKVALSEVAFLTVTDVTPIGAFVDWGLLKELLVPHAEQTRPLQVGDRHPIGLFVDDSGRLAGTMRVSEMVSVPDAESAFEKGEWVDGEAWRNEPELGLFVIVERAFVGLVPAAEPHSLRRGDACRCRVTNILPDRKIELSLRGLAHDELDSDAAKILSILASPQKDRASDRSSPELIRELFGLSKKAFKRAAGRLLRDGAVTMDDDGCFMVAQRPTAAK